MALSQLNLIGKSQNGQFFRDGHTGRWKTNRIFNIDGFGTPPSITTTGNIEAISIGGLSFGNGRILSVEIPAGDQFGNKGLGNHRYVATVEVFYDGGISLTNFPANALENLSYINGFSEDLSVSADENGNYQFVHTVNIDFIEAGGSFDPIETAKTVAENIFNGTDYESQIANLDKNIGYNRAGRKYYNESYNTLTNQCSFTKRYTLLRDNTTTNYTLTTTTRLSLGENGVSTITEDTQIISLNGYASLVAAIDTELDNSFGRCNAQFESFKGYFSGDSDSLIQEPTEIVKKIDVNAESATFTVSYSNAKNIDKSNGQTFSETQTLTKEGDYFNLCYNGTIKDFRRKRSDFDGVSLFSFREATVSPPSGYNKISKNVSVNKTGKEVSYEICYSSDPSISTSGSFRKIDVSSDDQLGLRTHENYEIPNQKVVVHDAGLTQNSARTITINTVLARNGSVFSTFPDVNSLASELESLLINDAAKVFTDYTIFGRNPNLTMAYYADHKCSLNSNRQFSVAVTFNYSFTRNNLDDKII